jgi:hypothetical protein
MEKLRKEMIIINDGRTVGLLHQEFRVFELLYKCT